MTPGTCILCADDSDCDSLGHCILHVCVPNVACMRDVFFFKPDRRDVVCLPGFSTVRVCSPWGTYGELRARGRPQSGLSTGHCSWRLMGDASHLASVKKLEGKLIRNTAKHAELLVCTHYAASTLRGPASVTTLGGGVVPWGGNESGMLLGACMCPVALPNGPPSTTHAFLRQALLLFFLSFALGCMCASQ
jgi:hypothetical protein